MISRLWYGWTTPENADCFEALLQGDIISELDSRRLQGEKGEQLMRREDAKVYMIQRSRCRRRDYASRSTRCMSQMSDPLSTARGPTATGGSRTCLVNGLGQVADETFSWNGFRQVIFDEARAS